VSLKGPELQVDLLPLWGVCAWYEKSTPILQEEKAMAYEKESAKTSWVWLNYEVSEGDAGMQAYPINERRNNKEGHRGGHVCLYRG